MFNRQQARAEFAADRPMLERAGVVLNGVEFYLPDGWGADYDAAVAALAMDAQPILVTDPNSALPSMLTTVIDPEVIRIIMAPLSMGEALGERKKGDWLTETEMFPVVEMTGEVSSYGDFNNNGRAGINMNWPQFQSYLFQTIISYGEKETARAGLGKINYTGELQAASAYQLNNYQNLTYAFGVSGLQNYGMLNNPYLIAALTPATKAGGGTGWFTSGGSPNATANEVYNDISALVQALIQQTAGNVDTKTKMTLILSPGSSQALTFANSFGVYVEDLLKKGFPNLTVKTAPQYGVRNATNPQGSSAAGNVMQLIADQVQGQNTVYCAFNEKLRTHKLVADLSAWKQKNTSGTWGTILRMPVAVSTMIGI